VKRETRHDRRARLEVQTLEGRELMSAGLVTGINPGHVEHRHLHPRAPRPQHNHPIPTRLHPFDNPPLRALARVPKPATPAIAGTVTAPDGNGSVTLTGQTYRRAKVSLQVNGTNVQTTRSNAKGMFQFTFTVGPGSTTVGLSATAHGHRPTSTTMTVNSNTDPPPPPKPSDLPLGSWDFTYEQIASREVTNKLTLTIPRNGPGRLEYAILTRDLPFDSSTEHLVHWVYVGNWSVEGSHLKFSGQGTITETNRANPSTNRTYTVNGYFDFPYAQVEKNGTFLDIVLDQQFGLVLSPGGPTRNLAMKKIG
jgi:hypothetical protein